MPPKARKTPKPIVSSGNATDSDEETIANIISTSESDTLNKAEFEDIIKKHLKLQENNLKGLIKSEAALLKAEIVNLQHEVETLKTENDNIKKQSEMNKSNLESLKGENNSLKSKIVKLENEQSKLADEIEDRTNRQLRKTMVFRGIPEESVRRDPDNEQSEMRKENWEETEELLAKSISDICDDTSISNARDMLERVHRSAPNARYRGSGPRPIFAAFRDWKDAEYVKKQFRINDTAFRCDTKYGPRTSMRRDLAMKERKRLKDMGVITSGYVDFPARLMVRDSNQRGTKYYLKRDFSKDTVILADRIVS